MIVIINNLPENKENCLLADKSVLGNEVTTNPQHVANATNIQTNENTEETIALSDSLDYEEF